MNNEEKILAMLTQMQEEQKQMREEQKQMREEQKQMRDDITGIKARLDYDINRRLDAMNEGIDTILEQLVPKSRVDKLEDDVVVLKTAVKSMAQRIELLEKAQ